LDLYEKSLAIQEEQLPSDHPEVAMSYSNIGVVHQTLGQYDLAIECYSRALKIRLKPLPVHHPNVALIFESIGLVNEKKSEWSKHLHIVKRQLLFMVTHHHLNIFVLWNWKEVSRALQ
jgi:tetratricopeptide (TPR) repeat protein